jgi:hypothetical protein
MNKQDSSPYASVAVQFAKALAAANFDQAHGLLSAELRADYSPGRLRADFEAMTEYGAGPPTLVELIITLEEWQWPEQQPEDLGWAYVAIANDTYSEAVAVIVKRENGMAVIRYVEWGRP